MDNIIDNKRSSFPPESLISFDEGRLVLLRNKRGHVIRLSFSATTNNVWLVRCLFFFLLRYPQQHLLLQLVVVLSILLSRFPLSFLFGVIRRLSSSYIGYEENECRLKKASACLLR